MKKSRENGVTNIVRVYDNHNSRMGSFTPEERETLSKYHKLIASGTGKKNAIKTIAQELSSDVKTVNSYLHNVQGKGGFVYSPRKIESPVREDIWHGVNSEGSDMAYKSIAQTFGISQTSARKIYSEFDSEVKNRVLREESAAVIDLVAKVEKMTGENSEFKKEISGRSKYFGGKITKMQKKFEENVSALDKKFNTSSAEEKTRNEMLERRLANASQNYAESVAKSDENDTILRGKIDGAKSIIKAVDEKVDIVAKNMNDAFEEFNKALTDNVYTPLANHDSKIDQIKSDAAQEASIREEAVNKLTPSPLGRALRYAAAVVGGALIGVSLLWNYANSNKPVETGVSSAVVDVVRGETEKNKVEVEKLREELKLTQESLPSFAEKDKAYADQFDALDKKVESGNQNLETMVERVDTQSKERDNVLNDKLNSYEAKTAENEEVLGKLNGAYITGLHHDQVFQQFLNTNMEGIKKIGEKLEYLQKEFTDLQKQKQESNDLKELDAEAQKLADELLARERAEEERLAKEQADIDAKKLHGKIEVRVSGIYGENRGQGATAHASLRVGDTSVEFNSLYEGVYSELENGKDYERRVSVASLNVKSGNLEAKLGGGSVSEQRSNSSKEVSYPSGDTLTMDNKMSQDIQRNVVRAEVGMKKQSKTNDSKIDFSMKYAHDSETTRGKDSTLVDFKSAVDSALDFTSLSDVNSKVKVVKSIISAKTGYESDRFRIGAFGRHEKISSEYEVYLNGARIDNGRKRKSVNSLGLELGISDDDSNKNRSYSADVFLLQNFANDLPSSQRSEGYGNFAIRIGRKPFALTAGAGYGRENGMDKGRGIIFLGGENGLELSSKFMREFAERNLIADGILREELDLANFEGFSEMGKNGLALFGEIGEGKNLILGASAPLWLLNNSSITGWYARNDNGEMVRVEPNIGFDQFGISPFFVNKKDNDKGESREFGIKLGGKF